MLRLLKLAALIVAVAVLGAVGVAWLGLEGAARRAAADATAPWAKEKRLSWDRVSTRLLPPSAVLEGAVLANAEGDELLRARRVVLPLLPGAWTGRGAATASPRLEGFALTLDVPRDDAANWAEALADKALPKPEWWSGSDGTVSVRVGGPDGAAISFADVRAKRRKYSFVLEGTVSGVAGSSARLDASWDPSGRTPVQLGLAAGPFDAGPWSAWLLPPSEGRVRGGRASIDGHVRFPGSAIGFEGTLDVKDLFVEGADARPGVFESAVRRGNGNGRFTIALQGPFAAGADWSQRSRDAVGTAAAKPKTK